MILCYITRGIGPIRPAIEAQGAARAFGWAFELVDGKELVYAKNHAAQIALQWEQDLLMVEDDMNVPEKIWRDVNMRADMPTAYNTIHYAGTRNRDGSSNVRMSPSGKFLFTGSCFCRISYYILCKLDMPIFQAVDFGYTSDGEQLYKKGPNDKNRGSDVYFWQSAQELIPPPTIECVGHVGHIKHPMNQDWNHQNPYEIELY